MKLNTTTKLSCKPSLSSTLVVVGGLAGGVATGGGGGGKSAKPIYNKSTTIDYKCSATVD